MTTETMKPKIFQNFTAVDLVTLAVFAALYRAMWYVWHALNFLFPFNQVLNCFFFVFCGVCCVMIVRKVGAATLFTIAAQLLNLFIQGEVLAAALMGMAMGLLGDVWLYIRVVSGGDPYSSLSDIFLVGFLMSVSFQVVVWVVMIPIVFLLVLEPGPFAAIFIAGLVGGIIAGWVGFGVGDKIRGLIA